MTPGLEHYEKRKFITVTELSKFACCPRKFFYGTGCGLRSRDVKVALKYGEAIHAGAPLVLTSSYAEALAAFSKVWDESGLEELGDKKRNKMCAYLMLTQLQFDHEKRQFPYQLVQPPKTYELGADVSPFEIPFAIDIGAGIPLVGRIDGFGTMCSTNEPWTVEFKTTSELGDRFFNSFTMNSQAIGYTVAARGALNMPDIRGCIVHGLFVSNANQRSLAFPIEVTTHMAEMWLAWARETVQMILAREASGEWTQAISGCNQIGMYGLPGYNCEFMQLCRTGPNWVAMKDIFKIDRHEPFGALGEMYLE